MIWTAFAVLFAAAAGWVLAGPGAGARRVSRALASPPAGARRSWRPRIPDLPGAAARRVRLRRASVLELCQALSAELAAGRTPAEALDSSVRGLDDPLPTLLVPARVAARDGGDVPAEIAGIAELSGFDGLSRLAVCWRVAVLTGGGLAHLVDRVAVQLRDEEVHRQEVAAQLAGPKATVRILALLPLLGLFLASGAGMRPLDFLLGGPLGLACLIGGAVLDALGLWWTHRMVANAERAGVGGG